MKIGIDLGGTKTEAILIDPNGKELLRKRIKTEKNYQGTLEGIKSIVEEFENTTAFQWLTSNAATFGFTMTYPRKNTYGIDYEPWHWCFTGVKTSL